MKITKIIATLAIFLLHIGSIQAQELPRKVENVTILNLDGEKTSIPHWGEKNILIFYIDPDRASQNQAFTEELEENKRIKGDDIFGMGVINLKDAPFIPNKLARSMAEKRTAKSKATVLADQERTLSTEWNLGDCNNKFVAILINRNGEIVYTKKGEFSKEDKEEFLLYIDKMK